MPNLDTLNRLPHEQAENGFLRCCGSRRWAQRMAGARPFASEADLFRVAEALWNSLFPHDWLEAFSHHPKIGQKSAEGWAKEEQSGTKSATSDVLGALAKGTTEYEKKFGHVFLVCATGKTAEEMLNILNDRLRNGPDAELRVAAKEQSKITRLRLEKWLRS